MKTAIIILSDPKNGSEEALGRVFNALAWRPNVSRRATKLRWSSMAPALAGRRS